MGDIAGLREVHDDVGRLTVSAFPVAMIKELSPARAAVPACYILANHATVRIGETGNALRRLSTHAADPTMVFAREVYVISGYQRAWFDKTAAIYLQYRLMPILGEGRAAIAFLAFETDTDWLFIKSGPIQVEIFALKGWS